MYDFKRVSQNKNEIARLKKNTPTFAMQNLLKQGVINHTSGHMPTSTLLSFLCNKKVGIHQQK